MTKAQKVWYWIGYVVVLVAGCFAIATLITLGIRPLIGGYSLIFNAVLGFAWGWFSSRWAMKLYTKKNHPAIYARNWG